MKPSTPQPLRDDVLYAFAVEPDPGRETLERYLRDYPQYAAQLVDLSRELSRGIFEDEEPLSAEDQALIDTAWRRHLEASPSASLRSCFAGQIRQEYQTMTDSQTTPEPAGRTATGGRVQALVGLHEQGTLERALDEIAAQANESTR